MVGHSEVIVGSDLPGGHVAYSWLLVHWVRMTDRGRAIRLSEKPSKPRLRPTFNRRLLCFRSAESDFHGGAKPKPAETLEIDGFFEFSLPGQLWPELQILERSCNVRRLEAILVLLTG